MIGRPGLDSGVRHAERFYGTVHHAVKVDFAHVAVVGVNDPVGIVNFFYSVKGRRFRSRSSPPRQREQRPGLCR